MPQSYAYRWLTQAMVTLLGVGGLILGVVIAAGGPQRFNSASFDVARLVPGGCYAWGAIFAMSGALTLLGAWRKRLKLTRAGLFAEAFGFLIFDVGLIFSVAYADARTPLTGCVVYALVAAIALAVWGASKELT